MIRNRACRMHGIVFSGIAVCAALLALATFSGCGRGLPSERPPIHLNPDMDNQPKYGAQKENRFFPDGAAMRQPVPGTIARGFLRDNTAYFTGRDENGQYVADNQSGITMQILERGRERYDIYCAPCHSRVGDGRGIMVDRGYVPPPSFHQAYLRDTLDGYLFDVVTNGVRNMPAYAHQIDIDDRWAIVAYLRALQKSRSATLKDVPEELRGTIKQAGP